MEGGGGGMGCETRHLCVNVAGRGGVATSDVLVNVVVNVVVNLVVNVVVNVVVNLVVNTT